MNNRVAIGALVAAYVAANYVVRLPGGHRVVLRVGAFCPRGLADLLEPSTRPDGALITAWNPMSHRISLAENRARQRAMLDRLRAGPVRILAGAGIGADWREPSLAVLGAPLDLLDSLARQFGQNAIVTFCSGKHVRLRLYRHDWSGAAAADEIDFAPRARPAALPATAPMR